MSVSQEAVPNSPLMLAWKALQESEEFKLWLYQAEHGPQREGVLWRLFLEGWNRRPPPAVDPVPWARLRPFLHHLSGCPRSETGLADAVCECGLDKLLAALNGSGQEPQPSTEGKVMPDGQVRSTQATDQPRTGVKAEVGAASAPTPSLDLDKIKVAAATVLEGFDKAIFIRNADGDGSSGWAVKLFPYLKALADLQDAITPKPEGKAGE